MSKRNFVRVYALAMAAAISVACSPSPSRTAQRNDNDSAKATTPAERTAGETGRAATDDVAVTTRVKSRMAAESRLASLKDVGVSTDNGVVTLTGKVPSDAYKKDVEQVARSTDGVTDVKNDLKVEKNATARNERRHSTTKREEDRDRGDNAH